MRERASHTNAGQSPCLSMERMDLGDEVIVVLRGEFDLSGVGMFDAALTQIAPGRSVILDLRYLSFLDSSGLEAMILLDRRARAEGWFLSACKSSAAGCSASTAHWSRRAPEDRREQPTGRGRGDGVAHVRSCLADGGASMRIAWLVVGASERPCGRC